MEPTPTPENSRQPRGLARFWPVHGLPLPVQRQSDEETGAQPRDLDDPLDDPAAQQDGAGDPRRTDRFDGQPGAQHMNGPEAPHAPSSGLLLPNGQPAGPQALEPHDRATPPPTAPQADRHERPGETAGFSLGTAHPALTSDTQMVALGPRRGLFGGPSDSAQPEPPTGNGGSTHGWTGNQPGYADGDPDRGLTGHRNGDLPRHGPSALPVNGLPGGPPNRLPPSVAPSVSPPVGPPAGPPGTGSAAPVSPSTSPVRPVPTGTFPVRPASVPTQAEPTQAEPTQAEPTQTEPTQTEPTQAEPTQTEPARPPASPLPTSEPSSRPVSAQPVPADRQLVDDPLGESGTDRSEPADGVGEPPLRPGDVQHTRITLFDDATTGQFHDEWHEVKAQFVDDPVTALTRAHDLLTGAVHELTESLLAERDDLDPLRRTSTPDTESMRMAMRGYREFLDRILAL